MAFPYLLLLLSLAWQLSFRIGKELAGLLSLALGILAGLT